MSLSGIQRKRRRDTSITIDVADYIDLFDEAIDPEEARRLYFNLENVHGCLTARTPNIQEALLYLERVLPLARLLAKQSAQ